MTHNELAEIGTYHFYLVGAVLAQKPTEDCIGDWFGYGEDNLVFDLYRLSAQWEAFDTALYHAGTRPETITVVYEVPEHIAKHLWDFIQRQAQIQDMEAVLPTAEEFAVILTDAMSAFA